MSENLTHINAPTLSAALLAVTFVNWLILRKMSKVRLQWPAVFLAVAAVGFATTAVWFALVE